MSTGQEMASVTVLLLAGLFSPALAGDWGQWCGRDSKNVVSDAKGLPTEFDAGESRGGKTARAASENVLWTARLGSQTYGSPVVAGGRIYVGTNNERPRDPKYRGDRGVLMCFREADGEFLWQLVVPKLPSGGNFNGDYGKLGICATPAVDGDRVYVMTNRCAVVCLDVRGLANGNDGPFKDEAKSYAKPRSEKTREGPDGPVVERVEGDPVELGPTDADILWRFDMMKEVRCWPQDASACSVLVHGDYVYVGVPNGVDVSHQRMPYPDAPSFLLLDKKTGRLVAVEKSKIGTRIFHSQWSSPSLGVVGGRTLVFYGAGDGFCYAFDAKPVGVGPGKVGTIKEVWRFDCNPPEHKVDENGKKIAYQTRHAAKGDLGPSECIGTAVFHEGRVVVSVGQDTLHGIAPGCLSCIDATKTGDISKTGKVWVKPEVDRSLSTAAVADGLVYWADYTGRLFCIDAKTGETVWTHELRDRVWSSPLVADGKVYLGTKRGYLHVMATGREKKQVARIKLDTGVFATPVVANGVLYVATMGNLHAVACDGTSRPSRPKPPEKPAYRPAPKEDRAFFNGKDLKGWKGDRAYWGVEDGQVVGKASRAVPKNQFLFNPVKVVDFHLSVMVRLAPNDRNSGIQFRSQRRKDGHAAGYQADVGRGVWGTLYHEHGRGGLDSTHRGEKHIKPGEWNRYEILAVGPRIWLAINGHLAAAVEDPKGEKEGFIAFQVHSGPPQDVRFKDIRLTHNPKVRLAGKSEKELVGALKAPER